MKSKKNLSITIRVDDALKQRIALQSSNEHREMSDFVRHAVITYLDKIEEVKKMTGDV